MSQKLPVALRLIFDASRCDGHGMCTLQCPERISLDVWGFGVADLEPITDPTTARRARNAVRCCPSRALCLAPAHHNG
jgi:ferredoxin